jgi:hypothetical protein
MEDKNNVRFKCPSLGFCFAVVGIAGADFFSARFWRPALYGRVTATGVAKWSDHVRKPCQTCQL